jgi:hypothetical protein
VGREPLLLPSSTAIGDFIAYTGKMMDTEGGLAQGYAMVHGAYFERMKEMGLYTPEPEKIHQRIRELGLSGVMAQRVA